MWPPWSEGEPGRRMLLHEWGSRTLLLGDSNDFSSISHDSPLRDDTSSHCNLAGHSKHARAIRGVAERIDRNLACAGDVAYLRHGSADRTGVPIDIVFSARRYDERHDH